MPSSIATKSSKISPKVSVIIPVYNREKYLNQAIESVLNQTFQDFEIIAVDDGSTHRSPELLKEWAKKGPRIRIAFHEKNRGESAARNTALSIVRGEWVMPLDSDDALHPQALEKLLKVAEEEEGYFVGSAILLCFNRKGNLVPWRLDPPVRKIQGETINYNSTFFLSKKRLPPIQPFLPYSKVKEFSLAFTEDCHFGEDAEFFYHLLRTGLKFKLLREPLYLYRLAPGVLTSPSQATKNFHHLIGVYERLLQNPGFSPEEKVLFQKRIKSLQREQKYHNFTFALKRRAFLEAFKTFLHHPWVLPLLLWRMPRSLSYRLAAKLKGGHIK